MFYILFNTFESSRQQLLLVHSNAPILPTHYAVSKAQHYEVLCHVIHNNKSFKKICNIIRLTENSNCNYILKQM